MGIWKLNTAGPRSTFDRPFPALRLLSIVVVTGEYIAPDFEGVDGNFTRIKGKISWLTRNQNKNFLSPCTYLFSCSLAWGSLILATSLLQFCWRMVPAAECQVFIPQRNVVQGDYFCFPFSLSSPPLLPSKHKHGWKLLDWERINEPEKEDGMMENSTCQYNVRGRKF